MRRDEIHSALRLLLATNGKPAGNEAVLDFLQFAVQRKIDVNDLWLAERRGRLVWALLPILSPGRTMLLFTPTDPPAGDAAGPAGLLVGAVCDHFAARGVQLAQILFAPEDSTSQSLYESLGFVVMAELVYLHGAARRTGPPPLPPGLEWVSYSPRTHAAFAQTIHESYDGSLDCPSLNGVRDIEDVVAGHKATGDFDPALWSLLCERSPSGELAALGTLLLSRVARSDVVELVYLGLRPIARGRGLGDLMMRQASHLVAAVEHERLSLAVDALNAPALRLYYRHGMQRVASKLAMMRQLASPLVAPPALALASEGIKAAQ